MDPCPFLRILVGSLALKLPVPSSPSPPSLSSIHPSSSSSASSSPCFAKIKLSGSDLPPHHQFSIPLVSHDDGDHLIHSQYSTVAACFSLDKSQTDKLLAAPQSPSLKIEVYRGKSSSPSACGLAAMASSGNKLVGKVSVPLDLRRAESRAVTIQNGWVDIGMSKKSLTGKTSSSAKLYVGVRAEPDPRFVFEFEKEPECSPQVFQVQGTVKQPVFTCKFGCRNNVGDGILRSRSSLSETSTSGSWMQSLFGIDKDTHSKERKGWSVTIHDLSGSPVAAASMVTPFVPSPGTDRVCRSNPGAWLILRPGCGTWKPWGRLEAWLECGSSDTLSYRFELLSDTMATSAAGASVVNSSISLKNGGKFTIDLTSSVSPMTSPSSSMDFGSGSWSGSGSGSDFGSIALSLHFAHGGFVMSSTMQGVECKGSKPGVEVGVQHVTCTEDAAAFVALAAAIDLSMDACRLFSHKLRPELRRQNDESVV